MTSQQPLRRGTTITHNGEPLTVLRVVGGTVVARDARGHTRHLWKARVLEAIQAAAVSAARVVESPAEVTTRACESLGVSAPTPATTATPRLDEAAAHLRDVEEYFREVFGEGIPRGPVPDIPRPVVYLFVAPETTPPQAA